MGQKARRKRIGKGIYRDAYGLSATVKVGTGDEAHQREKRFPFDTPLKDLKTWQESMRGELRVLQRRPAAVTRGTLEADAKTYLAQVKHLTSYKSRVCEVNAWTALYGRLRRSQITAEHVRKARAQWITDGVAPKTVNNRVQTLGNLYHVLDGEKAPTPADDITKLAVPESIKVLVPAKVFRAVAANLTDKKTRSRFMIIASTGVRPAEVRRAEPADVDIERGVWMVRTAKGGAMRAIVLNDEMLTAWKAFIAADAWGHFDGSDYAKALYAAGWPKDIRPYQARHSVALELGERGIDLADVASMLGHKDVATTRRHYQGILASRLKSASDSLAGRFDGWKPAADASSPSPSNGSASAPSSMVLNAVIH
jgi:site-specific recombinase XerD